MEIASKKSVYLHIYLISNFIKIIRILSGADPGFGIRGGGA